MTNEKLKLPRGLHTLLAVALLAAASSAHAQYHLSVFEKARAHDALTHSDPVAAARAFKKPAVDKMDYADINNLCVLQIIERNTLEATRNCRLALKNLREQSIRNRDKRKMQAVVLSNLSVALFLKGEHNEVEATLERALTLDHANKEAIHNSKTFGQTRIAAN
ncbi:MAG: hypothetical protein AB8B93_18310 [Pseudomonadales bacterium]